MSEQKTPEMYSRQILLPQIGLEGQRKIQNSKITIVGCGALGTVAAELLIRMGVTNLTLIDRDIVEISNLQRQSLYTQKDQGKLKANCARDKLLEINSNANIVVKNIHLFQENVADD